MVVKFSDAIFSYVYRVDAEWHLGLPSLFDVYSHDAVNIKERFQLSESSLTPSVRSTGYWIVRVPFPSL